MKQPFLIIVFLNISYCFAQINPMEYLYKNKCPNAMPDFAALAVLEKQSCPENSDDPWWSRYDRDFDNLPICTSRYRVIRILDAVSDTLKKRDYLEVAEYPVPPSFRHRPLLIFGNHQNGIIQINGYEETRDYFNQFDSYYDTHEQSLEFYPLTYLSYDIYALHSIGTPYYKNTDLDTIDRIYYNEYLIPYIKQFVEDAGRDFNTIWRRLTQKRTPIKTVEIKSEIAALVAIRNLRLVRNSTRPVYYELDVVVETVFKDATKTDSNTTAYIDKDRLPPIWGCLPPEYFSGTTFYLFGNLKNGRLVVDSLVSTRDMFVFGDTIYDISMGLLPYRELLSYFLPSNMFLEEFEFAKNWQSLNFNEIRNGTFSKKMEPLPKCKRDAIVDVAIKWVGVFDNKRRPRYKAYRYNRHEAKEALDMLFLLPLLKQLRCRKMTSAPFHPIWIKEPNNSIKKTLEEKQCEECVPSFEVKRVR